MSHAQLTLDATDTTVDGHALAIRLRDHVEATTGQIVRPASGRGGRNRHLHPTTADGESYCGMEAYTRRPRVESLSVWPVGSLPWCVRCAVRVLDGIDSVDGVRIQADPGVTTTDG